MIKVIIIYFLSIQSLSAFDSEKSQIKETWNKAVLEAANSAKNEAYLSEEEKKVIYYSNLVRINPQLFSETILQPYLDSVKMKNNKWITSLKEYLKEAPPAGILLPQQDLYKVAQSHALDMGKSGKIGHLTSSGKNYLYRIEDLKKKYYMVYENCQYGYKDALSIVIDLLIDQGVDDLGHRKALLNPTLKYAGASIEKHRKYRYNCVIEYGAEIKPPVSSQ